MKASPLRCTVSTARFLGAARRVEDHGVFRNLIVGGLSRSNPGAIIVVADDRSVWTWLRVGEARS